VSCGDNHTAAIKTDGTLWIWGRGAYGRLGNAVITGNRVTPVTTFAGGTNWKQVSCGGYQTAAIKTDGTLWTWGYGSKSRLGNGAISGNISTPVTTFAGGTNWKQVSCNLVSTAAIKTDGTLWAWGEGTDGRLGNNSFSQRSTPITTFAGGTNWKQVACGYRHMAAIKTDGTLWTWGYENNGALGNNIIDPFFPASKANPITTFAGGTNWKQVACGYQHTAAIKSVDFSPF
jgi:alpha-tubulin suppressor-like RCC1 family protein